MWHQSLQRRKPCQTRNFIYHTDGSYFCKIDVIAKVMISYFLWKYIVRNIKCMVVFLENGKTIFLKAKPRPQFPFSISSLKNEPSSYPSRAGCPIWQRLFKQSIWKNKTGFVPFCQFSAQFWTGSSKGFSCYVGNGESKTNVKLMKLNSANICVCFFFFSALV